jgi:DNA-binding CsgD family transcriptional regulator/predicted enzyme related to lactoylglutathione lyase
MTNPGSGRPRHDDVLTSSEWKVANQVRHGLSNPRIAERMGVSLDAVKFHVGNALGKLGFTSRAELKLWDDVAKGTALAAQVKRMEPQMQDPMTQDPITLAQIARTTKEFVPAHTWYRDVLGLRELYAFGNLAFFDIGGARLMLTEEEGNPASESILYFRVADIHAEKARLEERGVKFINAPHLIHRHPDGSEEWLAAFEDNEGRPLQLMAHVRR